MDNRKVNFYNEVHDKLEEYENRENYLLSELQDELIDEINELEKVTHGRDTRDSVKNIKFMTAVLLQYLIRKETGEID